MKLTMRRYLADEDYWRIREFLREVLLKNNRLQDSWETARFDYWRWHGILNMKDGSLEDDVFIWEKPDNQIAAVLNREAPGSVFLQVRPDCRSEALEEEMLSVAETHLTVPVNERRRALHVWCLENDSLRQGALARRGYAGRESKKPEFQRARRLSEPIPKAPTADGYTIRSLGDIDEHPARSLVSWRAFHPHAPIEDQLDPSWYQNVQRAPLYRRDLDIVAVAASGELAAFCTIWFDDVTRTGLFEPVGTAPEHQRRGLGKAVLTEGLRRLRWIGADLAYVGSFTEAAHGLYASVGFREYRILKPWLKVL